MLPQTNVAWWIAISILPSFTTATTVAEESNCTHVLNEGGAFINSMNFPDPYPNRHLCSWQITVPTGDNVSLRFSDFETEFCCDKVEVYDDPMKRNLIATFRGDGVPEVLVSSGNSMFITFKADATVQGRGFAGVLTTNGHSLALNDTNGTIHSPYYPAPFPRDSLFTWTFTVHVGDIVAMEFNNMSSIENRRDSIRVYDGNSRFGFFLGKFNKNKPNPPSDVIKSTGNQMFIVFYAAHSTNSNFIGEFTSYPAKSCMEQGNHLCDQICTDRNGTFECSCHKGFQVSSTDPYRCQECDEWTYGMACSHSCPCHVKTTNYCNKTNGMCMCKDGWTGIDCSTVLECDEWIYGVLCSSTCSCNVNTTNYCDKKNGTCVCNAGWTDASCSTEALPASSNLIEEPTLDKEIYWAIIGVLGFLLLTADIAIAVLVYKRGRKENNTKSIALPPPVEAMPLDEIIRKSSSDAQTEIETPGTISRDSRVHQELTDSSHHDGPTDRESEIYVNVPDKKEDSRPEEVYQNEG